MSDHMLQENGFISNCVEGLNSSHAKTFAKQFVDVHKLFWKIIFVESGSIKWSVRLHSVGLRGCKNVHQNVAQLIYETQWCRPGPGHSGRLFRTCMGIKGGKTVVVKVDLSHESLLLSWEVLRIFHTDCKRWVGGKCQFAHHSTVQWDPVEGRDSPRPSSNHRDDQWCLVFWE